MAAVLFGAPGTAEGAPAAADPGSNPPTRVVQFVPATQALTPPSNALTTSWPVVASCASPRWLDVAGYHGGTLRWSNVAGSKQVWLGQELASESLVLPANTTPGMLERLWVSAGPTPEGIYLDCGVNDDGRGDHSIEWNLSDSKQAFEVTARYRAPRTPRAWRVARWIEAPIRDVPTKPTDFAPFVAKIMWDDKPERDVAAASLSFTHDMLTDLRDLIAVACGERRCANVMRTFSVAARNATRDPKAAYERLDKKITEVEPFGHRYEWRMSTEAAQALVGCDVTSSYQILCELSLTTTGGQRLNYNAWYSTLELVDPTGSIEFVTEPGGGTRLTISGAALALRGKPESDGSR